MADGVDLCRAISWAAEAMGELTDKQGQPAILHALRVCLAGKTIDEQIVGVLHDCVEDTRMTCGEIVEVFGDEIGNAVSMLTRAKEYETYAQYIDKIAPWPLARAVKINDLKDNIARSYTWNSPEADSLRQRYQRALFQLERPVLLAAKESWSKGQRAPKETP